MCARSEGVTARSHYNPSTGKMVYYECVICGRPLLSRRNNAKTCGARCRKRLSRSGAAAWNRRHYCQHCGCEFSPKQPGQRPQYCSNRCRQAAYRARRKREGDK